MLIVSVKGLPANCNQITYVGRKFGEWIGSPLGNPFRREEKCKLCGVFHPTDESTLGCYRKYLFARIKANNKPVLDALRSLNENSVLGCWCCNCVEGREVKDQRCHAEVVASAWRYYTSQGLLAPAPAAEMTHPPIIPPPQQQIAAPATKKTPRRGGRKQKPDSVVEVDPPNDFDDSELTQDEKDLVKLAASVFSSSDLPDQSAYNAVTPVDAETEPIPTETEQV